MGNDRQRWNPAGRASAYVELEHPADLFLEVYGRDLPELAGNALFAFYDQIAELAEFDLARELTIEAAGAAPDEALRALLAEALYRLDTDGFVAAGGNVTVEGGPHSADAPATAVPDPLAIIHPPAVWRFSARLWGDNADRERHTLLREVKAVTYHRLAVGRTAEGWKATILLDI